MATTQEIIQDAKKRGLQIEDGDIKGWKKIKGYAPEGGGWVMEKNIMIHPSGTAHILIESGDKDEEQPPEKEITPKLGNSYFDSSTDEDRAYDRLRIKNFNKDFREKRISDRDEESII